MPDNQYTPVSSSPSIQELNCLDNAPVLKTTTQVNVAYTNSNSAQRVDQINNNWAIFG